MYFPGDPLFPFDPIFNSVPDEKARDAHGVAFDLDTTEPDWALGYSFDIVLRGRNATPMDTEKHARHHAFADRRPLLRLSASTPAAITTGTTLAHDLVTTDASGERIRIEGRVFDGDGKPISDAMLEIWQADAQGRYAHPARRAAAERKILRLRPRRHRQGRRLSLPHHQAGCRCRALTAPCRRRISWSRIFARGMRGRLYTRIYFADEAANASDPILALVPDDRRATLIAKREDGKDGPLYRFDIHLQGEQETVFFDL